MFTEIIVTENSKPVISPQKINWGNKDSDPWKKYFHNFGMSPIDLK